jgi:hypothetical protein
MDALFDNFSVVLDINRVNLTNIHIDLASKALVRLLWARCLNKDGVNLGAILDPDVS